MSALLLLLALAAGAPPEQYDAPTVPDPVLADQRGGFRLPTGIDVAMTVQTQTAVNGAVVLATVFRADQGAPTITTYVPMPGETVAAPAHAAGDAPASAPSISYDSRNGLQVTRIGSPSVSISAAAAAGDVAAGLVPVAGDATTAAGAVTQSARGGLSSATLSAGDLSVTHFAGNAFGSAIANSGSDRAITTDTTLSIDLRGAGPDVLGSAMLRAADLADSAVRSRF